MHRNNESGMLQTFCIGKLVQTSEISRVGSSLRGLVELLVPINSNLICLSLPETNKAFKIKDDIQFISRV